MKNGSVTQRILSLALGIFLVGHCAYKQICIQKAHIGIFLISYVRQVPIFFVLRTVNCFSVQKKKTEKVCTCLAGAKSSLKDRMLFYMRLLYERMLSDRRIFAMQFILQTCERQQYVHKFQCSKKEFAQLSQYRRHFEGQYRARNSMKLSFREQSFAFSPRSVEA